MDMGLELDHLIQSGWEVIQSDFGEKELRSWRKEAFECVRGLMGPEHPYTQYFRNLSQIVDGCREIDAAGIVPAVKGHLYKDAS